MTGKCLGLPHTLYTGYGADAMTQMIMPDRSFKRFWLVAARLQIFLAQVVTNQVDLGYVIRRRLFL